MYQHIIVPFDGTQEANRSAMLGADLATMFHARLVVATSSPVERDTAMSMLKNHAIRRSDHAVTVWIEPARSHAEALQTMVSYRRSSLICMYTHGRTGVRRGIYGSLAETLLQVVDSPILMTGPEWTNATGANLNHLIVCVDGSPTAEAAIPLAGAWAEALPLVATLLHVRTGQDELPVDLDRLATPLRSRFDIVETLEVDNRDVVAGVLDVVGRSVDPFLVTATHARTGLDRLLHGSVVAQLGARSPAPVLVQRGPLPTIRFRTSAPEQRQAG